MCAYSGLYPTDLFSLVGPARSARLPAADIALGVIEARKPSHHFKGHAPGDGTERFSLLACGSAVEWVRRNSLTSDRPSG